MQEEELASTSAELENLKSVRDNCRLSILSILEKIERAGFGQVTVAHGTSTTRSFLFSFGKLRPLGGSRVIWLCLKNLIEIAVAKP